jgi:hypothetical protein
MQAPVSFTFSVVPKGARATEGRVLVRTGDEMFDARFAARTDHPTQAKMLVTSKMMRTQMEKLCCSSKTFLTMTTGSIELSELIIPEPHTGRHVLDHVASMAALAAGVENIPGAENVKIKKYEKERSTPMLRIAIGIGAVTALCAVFVMKQAPEAAVLAESQPPFAGIFPVDERAIPAAMYWRTMKAEDFNPDVVGYLRNYGIPAEGRFLVNTDGDDRDDVVYFLTNEQGKRRVVLLQDGANVLDSVYEEMVGVVRIPHDSMQNLEWTQKPSEEAMGDALMIIRGSNVENFKAMILFPVNGRVVSGIPARYENISLK